MVKSKVFEEILKDIPLDIRFRVASEFAFIDLITELGYREEKMWTKEEDAQLQKLMKLVEKHKDDLLKELQEWEETQPQKFSFGELKTAFEQSRSSKFSSFDEWFEFNYKK